MVFSLLPLLLRCSYPKGGTDSATNVLSEPKLIYSKTVWYQVSHVFAFGSTNGTFFRAFFIVLFRELAAGRRAAFANVSAEPAKLLCEFTAAHYQHRGCLTNFWAFGKFLQQVWAVSFFRFIKAQSKTLRTSLCAAIAGVYACLIQIEGICDDAHKFLCKNFYLVFRAGWFLIPGLISRLIWYYAQNRRSYLAECRP